MYIYSKVYRLSTVAYFIWSCQVHHANISLLLYSLDPVNEEPELEVQAEQVQAEETNPEPEQGKPRYITPQSLTYILNLISLC
jgi:hypothetical protein